MKPGSKARRGLSALALAALPAAIVPAATMAETYTASTWFAPTHLLSHYPYMEWHEALAEATGGEIAFEVYNGSTLLPPKATMSGVADGVAEVGIVYPGYQPAELPLNNLLIDASFVSDNHYAAAFAYTDMIMNTPEVYAEWSENGVVTGPGFATAIYNFVCASPVYSVAQAKGKKFRTAGAAQVDFVESIGGIAVSVPFSEVYTGMQRGSLDCAMVDATTLTVGPKLAEVSSDVTEIPVGIIIGSSWVYNKSFWRSLPEETRATLMEQMILALARMEIGYEQQGNEGLEGARAQGVNVGAPEADLAAALDSYNTSFLQDLPAAAAERFRIAQPEAILAEFMEKQDAWKARLAEVDIQDQEVIIALLEEHIFSKVDIATYGMED
ncbi:C4-dicarboxylate TRAP transporter substrate-binding protein [Oceanicola sp. S124]|uniref:C4-dicarboxylate TRAP transporter substrate-binding protein n=1 Tax=Oceanicola sp. S124 TaxID=1042378 RepID=UPI0002557D69|nr:C4-dicarboxylate TRAP transporter substrate-binding protein [Oceanicola sp. S124]